MPPEAPGPPRVAHVVDDEAQLRRSLGLLLRAAGFAAHPHASGESFLEAAPRLPFGCVLLDIRLPGLDRLGVLREMAARGLRLPVVVVTAHGDVQLAVQAMKAGAFDFVEKPCSGAELIGAAEAALAPADGEPARGRGAGRPRRGQAEQGDRDRARAESPHG